MIPSFKRSIIFILMNKTFKLQGNSKVLVLFFLIFKHPMKDCIKHQFLEKLQ